MHRQTPLIGLVTAALMFTNAIVYSQAVGIGTPSPDASALLEVSGTDKGVLIPRLTTAQRGMISDPAVGLLVFDTDTESFWFKESAGWVNLVVHEADPQVSSTTNNVVPKWNGTSLVDGAITDNDSIVSISGHLFLDEGGGARIEGYDANHSIYLRKGWNGANDRLELHAFGSIGLYTGFGDIEDQVERLHIQQEGNVGIGTSNPSAKLEVAGGDALINSVRIGLGNNNMVTNTAAGNLALNANTTGAENTAVGYQALSNNADGGGNTAHGYFTLRDNTIGWANTAIGDLSMTLNQAGYDNTGVGIRSLHTNSTGFNNTAVGARALELNTTGRDNTAIGADANVGSDNLVNASAIGAGALVNTSNSLVLGNNANVGIGTSSPETKLHVVGGLKLVDGTQGDGKVLVSDANGLASWQTTAETDPQVGDLTNNKVPKWNGSSLVNGLITDNNTNVGIGTTTPTSRLHVTGTPNGLTVVTSTAGSGDSPLLVRSNNGGLECMTIRANGNVGIGTVNPAARFHVESSLMLLNNPASNSTAYFDFKSGTSGHLTMGIVGGSDGEAIVWNRANRRLTFGTNDLPRMTILANGNVGIGTQSPSAQLYVQADLDGMTIQTTTSSGSDTPLLVRSNNGSIECLIVRANGNVGIGTTSPQSRLAVNGTITCKEVEVTLAGFPDYVFEDNYDLMSLQDVEAFINTYGHLPNVPSAQEVEENGIGLGALNKILLEKIEELTLHMIEKDAQIEWMQKEFNAQRKEIMDRMRRFENMIEKS